MNHGNTRKLLIGCVLAGACALAAPAWSATDYSSMSTEEMAAMRGGLRDASPEEREAFRTEWRNRTRSMSQEERRSMSGRPSGAPQDGSGARYGRGQGGGGSYSSAGGMGRGMGRGGRR